MLLCKVVEYLNNVLNSNIRCIEIYKGIERNTDFGRWIVTLDVLKFALSPATEFSELSWIVTLDVLKYITQNRVKYSGMLNSNIRCIEIHKK